jgi:molecular chaperone GrpE (heat shock protein)
MFGEGQRSMPAMLRIDTLKFAKRLTDAGMDRRQAEALVEGLNEADTSEFATRADIGDVKAEIGDVRAEIAEVKAEMAAFRRETKAEFAAVRSETKADIKAELFRFMYVQAMGVVGLTVGLTVALIKLLP